MSEGNSPKLTDDSLAFLVQYQRFRRQQEEEEEGGVQQQSIEEEEDAVSRRREHVLQLWERCLAEASVMYRCVRELWFLQPKINLHFHYAEVLSTPKADPHARFMDLGCCFGTDTRRVITDGWKEESVVPVDVIPDFWNFGLQLYQDDALLRTKVQFGDLTCDDKLEHSLSEGGLFAHVWTGLVLHVLDQAKAEALLRSVFRLLRPGGTYFGTCVGSGEHPTIWSPAPDRSPGFLHTSSSLSHLLAAIGFEEVTVLEDDTRQGDNSDTKKILTFKARKPLATPVTTP